MKISIISIIGLLTIGVGRASAGTIVIDSGPIIITNASTSVNPQDLSSIDLGEVIIGPLGSVVSDDFTTNSSEDIGDLNSSVFDNSATGLFTYTHQVIPGVNDIDSFAVSFPASGFNGVAGYDFSQASAAGGNGDETDFDISFNGITNETITWNITSSGDSFFDTGETITFFWQSTLRPVGPFGTYNLDNNSSSGNALGPSPNAPNPEPIPEPSSWGLLSLFSLFCIGSNIIQKFARKVDEKIG